jgi:PAS domain-containing protein
MKKANLRVLVLPLLLVLCGLFYYFGELVDWASLNALRANFFYGIHDIHRLLFLIPIVYAAYIARVKGAIIVTLISFLIFLPRAFFISPYPDPLLRMVIFVIFAGTIGILIGIIRNKEKKEGEREAAITEERKKLVEILNGFADGIMITDQDYKIRYMNPEMLSLFGDGTGATCYQHLRKLSSPCQHDCRVTDVITHNKIQKWQCEFPDNKKYEVIATPYIDIDGSACQISLFRKS